MDKPFGPRLPDKRHEAYESIFGRPSTIHHQISQPHPSQPSLNHPHPWPFQPNGHSYHYQPSQYQPNLERRPSYTPSYPPYLNQQSHPVHRHSHLSSPPSQPPQPYPYAQPPYPNTPSIAPPGHAHTSSVSSSAHRLALNLPQPEEPPDPTFDPLTTSNLTPAQAYQAQVYRNAPQDNPHNPPSTSDRNSLLPPRNGKRADLPRLGVSFDADDGTLGIDFGPAANGSGSDQGTDEGSSELPWARKDQLCVEPSRIPPVGNVGKPLPHSSSRPYPLQVDTDLPSARVSVTSYSPSLATTLVDGMPSPTSPSARRSSESSRTIPLKGSGPHRQRSLQDRSMSMSAAPSAVRSLLDSARSSRQHYEANHSPTSTRAPARRRTPIVYPAMLSRVAAAFRDRIQLSDRVKDSLTYKDAFDGREAVDKIAYIIKTTDRNLALLLGRALDAQKFFHDVTYDHRLRDSSNELYQFRTKLPSPFVSGDLDNEELAIEFTRPDVDDNKHASRTGKKQSSIDRHLSATTIDTLTPDSEKLEPRPLKGSVSVDDIPLPSGVFTLLTDCYSPTCSRDQLCYSIACPRRLEQQARLNMKPQPGLKKQISRESLGDVVEPGTLWIHSVSQEVANSVSDTEKKRQEAINEVIYTERDFVRDMEYLRDSWYNRLKDQDIIPQPRRSDFLEQVFWNIFEIIAVNTRLRDALNKRQKSYAVVECIGDIFSDAVPHFGPFVTYGAHQLYGKYQFEQEKNSNPAFASFVEATERLPESRKLELNAYLTKPTTRLARYPLLLEAVLKHTPDDSSDKKVLPKVITLVREFLGKVNVETGKTENRFNLIELDQQLDFKPGEQVDLRLRDEGRELILKGPLNKRGGGVQGNENGDLQVYLFDHALLMVKHQKTKHEQYRVYRRPIPLELLLVSASEDPSSAARSQSSRQKQALVKRNSFSSSKTPIHMPNVPSKSDSKGQHSITFVHLGRKYYQIMLWANTYFTQRKWLEHITKQQEVMRERSLIFDTVTLSEGFFSGPNKVNCAAPFHFGRRVVFGTDDGIYLSDLRTPQKEPVKVLALLDVAQVDVLEDYQLLIVLSERQVITFPLDALDSVDPMAGLKRAKRISAHTTFFKAGICLGRVLVCVVKSSPLSSTIKTLEPIDHNERGKSKPTFRKLLQGGNDTLKFFREFYIPVESNSIHFLKTKLCVGCSKGFEIVDLESLDTQGLLDPTDESLEFMKKKENLRPMAIYRIDNEFLLCYDDFAFYVNKNGRRSRKEFMVHWEASPTGFALHFPYVLAFEPTFIEIRHVETGLISQVIQGSNLRLLFADTPPSTTNTASNMQLTPQPSGFGGYHSYPVQRGPSMARQSAYSGYGIPPPYPSHPNQYARPQHGISREEIIVVSDDRVLALRPSTGTPSDHPSPVSGPR